MSHDAINQHTLVLISTVAYLVKLLIYTCSRILKFPNFRLISDYLHSQLRELSPTLARIRAHRGIAAA
jgi:hypothetical protein